MAVSAFITNDGSNVSSIIVAGSSAFKNKLVASDHFDLRLKPLVFKIIDISYGGMSGLEQALVAVSPELASLPLMREREQVCRFFERVRNSDRVAFGPKETVAALEAGVVEEILVDEDLSYFYIAGQPLSKDTGETLFTEYLSDHYEELRCQIHFISGQTSEGCQFIRGFNGIGALLKYNWDFCDKPDITSSTDTQADATTTLDATANPVIIEKEPFDLDLDDFFM